MLGMPYGKSEGVRLFRSASFQHVPFVSQSFFLLACASGRSPAEVKVRLIPIHPRQPWMCMKAHPRWPLAGTLISRPEAFSAK